MTNFLSREDYHKKKSKKIYWKDDCPFCKKSEQKKRIIWEWKYWYILHNISPYSWDHRHIMAVPYQHIKYFHDIEDQKYFKELKEVKKVVKDFFWNQEYFSFTRESMWNRSVEHLHIHFLVWKLQGKFLRKMLELQWYPIKEEKIEIKIK